MAVVTPGFNPTTAPLTMTNAQNTWQALTTPTVTPKASTSVTPTTQQPANTSSPAQAAPKADPYAQWGGYANYSKAVNDYNAAKDTTYNSINDAISDTGAKFGSSIQDYIDSLTQSQKNIDRSAVQNELAKEQGRLGVLDTIGSGIRNAGTILSAKGATNSSAAEQIARIYNQLGQRQQTGVNNQYETGLGNIQDQQDALALQTAQFQRHYGENKTSAVNNIVQDASSKLAQLNAAAQNASLAERIDIEAQKAAIRNQALQALAQYDEKLNTGVGGVKASTQEANQAKAMQMLQAGIAPDNAFTYTTVAPPQWANTGPVASPLQIYAAPQNRKNDQLTSPLGV